MLRTASGLEKSLLLFWLSELFKVKVWLEKLGSIIADIIGS